MTEPAPALSRRGLLTGAAVAAGTIALPATAYAAPAPPRPARPVPVGFVLSHEQFQTQALVQWGAQAEAAGFGLMWTSDHLQPWQDVQGHSMHPWMTQALLSAATSRATFGTGVTCPIYRYHPSEVAQAWATLGILAPGRVFLGVGTGEALNEKAGTGQFGPYAERAARLVEAVQLIRRLWEGERVTWSGTYYSVDRFQLYDVPERPVPIYMAASGPKSAYNAGLHGDGWICSAADIRKPELRDAFARGARAAGKDPDAMPKYVEVFVNVGDGPGLEYAAKRWRFTVDPWDPSLLYDPDPVSIQQKANSYWPLPQVYGSWPKTGDPADHVAALQGVLDLGGTPFVHSGQRNQSAVIDFYGRHVLPQLKV
ncbi:TIGR03557 family F420-dependent LLM class oxidoreductase [Motilibacter aurantiacus]|uniref:TIGR03557 family F420-dependent LLM class oxidoreductase n=1 Tax=Motilibacter aurantiacus TaxID=2714955 RepID=UPI001409A05E|nr:TIGR03557 family F420-dependent LLM class oxidoreductase [Motilibacter aurantiacus]NHC46806.1 TIGR03557 family F420-dependent LLM class oxidoreductase [Motilibacter aurantiacus]